jgi:integrase
MRGQIIEKSKGVFLVRIQTRNNGKRESLFSQTVKGKKSDADKLLTKKLAELDSGILVKDEKQTLNEYLDFWIETVAKNRVRENTLESYNRMLDLNVRPLLGKRRLSSIKPHDIQRIYTAILERGLMARSVEYTNAVLSSAFKQAVKWQMLHSNPCDAVDLPKKQRAEMKAFSPKQAALFLQAAKESKHYVLLTFALVTGMRPSEYLALRWSDLDLQKGTATVQRSVTQRPGGGFVFGETKTKRSRRTIPLPESLVKELKHYRAAQLEQKLKLGEAYQKLDLVFANSIGCPISYKNVDLNYFKPVLKKAGLEGFRLYDLRHSCATLLLAAGENPKVVAERLGHSTIVLTLDTYSHVLPDMQRAATEKLERILNF